MHEKYDRELTSVTEDSERATVFGSSLDYPVGDDACDKRVGKGVAINVCCRLGGAHRSTAA